MNLHLGYLPGCIGRVVEMHATYYARAVPKTRITTTQAILSQLDNSYGVSDVVRIAVASPNQAASEMLASDDPAVMFALPKSVPVETPKVIAMASPKKAETSVVKSPAVAPVETPKKVAAPTANIGGKTVKKGSIVRLEKLYFDVDKSEVKNESETELNRLFEFLNAHPGVTIEVRGHTNNQMWPNVDFANELSSERAKAVTDWLIAKGITANRIQFKGYGWTMPVEPNINAEGRKKNQRAEENDQPDRGLVAQNQFTHGLSARRLGGVRRPGQVDLRPPSSVMI